jgi:hypothetical protein
MALKVQSSFSSGELDTALHERTTLAKFKAGLKTARNVVVGKTGSIMSRPSRKHLVNTRYADRAVKIYSPPGTGYLIEWGHLYVRVYDPDGALLHTTVHTRTEDDLATIKFETGSSSEIYIFCLGLTTLKFQYIVGAFATDPFYYLASPVSSVLTPAAAGTGYTVDYAFTYIQDGQESVALYSAAAGFLPISVAQSNILNVKLGTTAALATTTTEMKVYRRPNGGGVYGYLGSTSSFVAVGADHHAIFTDFGQEADYSQSPPVLAGTNANAPGVINFLSGAGAIYQQRLVLSTYPNEEGILASRPGFQNNFFRDYPLGPDSALKFRAGSSGYAKVYDLLDSDGLIAFTSRGIFLHSGPLTPENLSMVKKGSWIIKQDVSPLAIPGGVFFVDSATNSIRNLVWSQDLNAFNGQEVSVFSDHLFREREVVSWAFQEGRLPLLWVVFSDGSFASFTYDFDHEMKAWTRHDSGEVLVEQVAPTSIADKTYFVVNKDGVRSIECTIPRFLPAEVISDDAEADKGESIAFMDSMVTQSELLNDLLNANETFWVRPHPATPTDWEGELFINAVPFVSSPFVNVAVGDVLRVFDEDGCAIDLEVLEKLFADKTVRVKPNTEFPDYMELTSRIYKTATEVTGLDHLEGEVVSVIADGFVMASPNNDIDNYNDTIVENGSITLPDGMRGAIIHVGRPITADVETLDIDTIEQAPTVVEAMTINKLDVKVHNTSGLYIGAKFPANDKVNGNTDSELAMQPVDSYEIDYDEEYPILGNRYPRPKSGRVAITLPGDWKSQGRMAMRQVDPQHFQVLSVIPDVEILRRSDR